MALAAEAPRGWYSVKIFTSIFLNKKPEAINFRLKTLDVYLLHVAGAVFCLVADFNYVGKGKKWPKFLKRHELNGKFVCWY